MRRVIVHLDADAFYASVEQSADPRLRGKPIAVGGEKRGIIASASYEARKYGVYTPMPTVQARKLCPRLIVLPGDFERYEQFSRWMFSYAYDFTPDVEQTSIDEGYFDLSATSKSPREVAAKVQTIIRQSLKITVSEGLATNKLVSQIAGKYRKPAGFTEVPAGGEAQFLAPLPNKWLPGIGPKTSLRFDAAGLALISHIAATPVDLLELLVGNQALQLRQFAQGVDARPLVPLREPAKSFSEQHTFGVDVTDEEFAEATLRRMADHLFARVRAEGHTVRTLTVKVRYNDFTEDQCGESLSCPTSLETDIYSRLWPMLRKAWRRRVSLRLVSLKLSNVHDGHFSVELPLEAGARRQGAHERLARVIDGLRQARGHSVILRGHDFRLRTPPTLAASPAASPVPAARVVIQVKSRAYVPLRICSHYTFLKSTLSPAAIVKLAAHYDLPAVALTDRGNLHGAAEFAQAARAAGIKPIFGAELRIGSKTLLAYVANAEGYRNLCRLLSRPGESNQDDDESVASRQGAPFTRRDLEDHSQGLLAVSDDPTLAELFPGRFYTAAKSRCSSYPVVACPPTHYGLPEDRLKLDVVQSIRTRTLLRQDHPDKASNSRPLHFRSPAEMNQWLSGHPDWAVNSIELAERCEFQFPFGPPQFPDFQTPDGSAPRDFLRHRVLEGLGRRYQERADQFKSQIEEELSIIAAVGYEGYFLMVWDILQDCRSRSIEWITRGSAADSLVCYCLGISDVCPIRFDLYFKRFLNRERMALNKLPDIDIDFPHDRKDDVIDLIFARFGKEHCAAVGGFSTFQARAAFADIAKVLGVSDRQVRRFTEHFPWSSSGSLLESLQANVECGDLPLEEEPYRTALEMAAFLDGVPRNPKMHPCGVVLSRQPMHELTPTFQSAKGYPTTQLDMDAVELVGLVKLDVLAQGGLAVLRDAKEALVKRGVRVDFPSLEPWADPAVWDMIAGGGARAVHHVESPAMTSLCQMTNVREIDGLIGIVAVIRPGAANESKKLSFTRRYQGLEPTLYPHPSLEPCLRSTFGLVTFEEHILQICEAFAGLPPGRADVLRRALNKEKKELIAEIQVEFFACALARGHSEVKTAEVWELVTGFVGYAFNKAHSTAYGVEAYWGAWMKRYHPAEFLAGVLTNGKGFYSPLVYVLECHRLGLNLLSPSVNAPGPKFEVVGSGIRVPLTRLKGITDRTTQTLLAEHRQKPFASLPDFFARVIPAPEELEAMISAGAFDEFGRARTEQFWEAQYLRRTSGAAREPAQGWLLPLPGLEHLPEVSLREPTRHELLEAEQELFGFPIKGHPLDLFTNIAWDTYCPVNRLAEYVGQTLTTCGLVIEQRVHHQSTGEPMKFMTIADYTGMVETELFAASYRRNGLATVRYPVLEIEGKVEPFENGNGYTLRVLRAGQPRLK